MKKIVSLTLALAIAGTASLVLAQAASTAPAAAPANAAPAVAKPGLLELIKAKFEKINTAEKAGALDKAKAKGLKVKLNKIKAEIRAEGKVNGNKLTDEQIAKFKGEIAAVAVE
jgi:hypothetical protein